jgi:hypothetical protein
MSTINFSYALLFSIPLLQQKQGFFLLKYRSQMVIVHHIGHFAPKQKVAIFRN